MTDYVLPVPGDRVTCGMRFELPKDKRGHNWTSLGVDVRHFDDGYLMEAEVFACTECGRDKMKRPHVPRVTVDEVPLQEFLILSSFTIRALLRATDATDDEIKTAFDDFNAAIEALNMKRIKG